MENVPCETQPAIRNLSAPPGPPIQPERTSLTAPGASLRWKSATEAALAQIVKIVGRQGLKVEAPGISSVLRQVTW
jgi:hypothetical protein